MTIRARLALLFTVSTLILVVGGTIFFGSRLRAGLDNGLDGRLYSKADTIATQVSALRDKPPDITKLKLSSADGIVAQILTTNGRVLKATRGLTSPLLSVDDLGELGHGTLNIDGTAKVLSDGDTVNEAVRVYARPLLQLRLIIVVAINREQTDKAVASATHQLLVWSAVALLLAGPAAWLLTRAALAPVERIRREFARLDLSESDRLVTVPRTKDEIGRLAETFNRSLLRLRAFIQREQDFVADAGHELRTPLTVLKGEFELAQRPGRTVEQLNTTISVAAEETDRLIKLAEDLLLLARDEKSAAPRVLSCDLGALIRQAAAEVATANAQSEVGISFAGPPSLEIVADPDRIRRAIANVLANAFRYSPEHGTVLVTTRTSGNTVVVSVRDDGPGFHQAVLPVAFERFTRAAETASGDAGHGVSNGLGLAIVRSAMRAHRGTAEAQNRPEGGALVTLRWPIDATAPDTLDE